jgi:UDP-N-acetylmuramoylalanine--D-glutamate ligase
MKLEVPEFLSTRLAKPAAVFGAGVSGDGALALLSRLGVAAEVYDRKGTAFDAQAAGRHGIVVFSPGFELHHPWLELARKAGCICMAEIDFASHFWRGRIVAVTGTNGKTTLAEFLAHALAGAGIWARACGNIGLPFSRLAADEEGGTPGAVAVCEVSSFQAEQLGHLWADALLWTNFAEDHLERHPGLEAYFAAKWELVLRTSPGRFLAGSSVQRHAGRFSRPMPAGSSVATEGQPADPALEGTPFQSYPMRENFILAEAWWKSEGLDPALLLSAARTFRVGRHRLSNVATVDGVTFWNDSKATNFHAVEAALAGFRGPVVLIAGGRSKGGDLAGFVRRIAPRVAHAVLIGEMAPALATAFGDCGVPHSVCATLEDAVRAAAGAAPAGGAVLLSPGFASFDMFRGYEDRGDRFERAVADLHAARV